MRQNEIFPIFCKSAHRADLTADKFWFKKKMLLRKEGYSFGIGECKEEFPAIEVSKSRPGSTRWLDWLEIQEVHCETLILKAWYK